MRLRNEYYPRFRTFSSTTDFCISGICNLPLLKAVSLGAEAGINYKTEDFAARVSELTEGRGANIILDCVGGSYAAQNIEALAVDGRYHRLFLKYALEYSFKGTVSRNFLLLVFFMNQFPSFPPAPDSQVKVHHRYQRHRRQSFPPFSLMLLIPVANLPPVSTNDWW
jgi:hypothetical protein